MVEDAAYATLFATLKQLYWITLQPFCDYIAAMLTRQLAKFFGDDLIIEIRCKRIDDHEITFQGVDRLLSMRGFPAKVIRYVMERLEMPLDEKMIEEQLSQPEQPPGMEQGMGGMPQDAGEAPLTNGEVAQGGEEQGNPELDENLLWQEEEPDEEDEETERQRPNPGTLNR